ncbi:MAG: hypothetical protein JW862_02235 [Anaerolineales bacterium]|nr:hypothetical protein [Anaerolineales bacterium]
MYLSNHLDSEHLWNRLQEPPRPANLPTDFLLLMAALDTGWQIEGSVCLLPAFGGAQRDLYLFNLRQPTTGVQRQLSLKKHPRVEAFICQEGLACEASLTDC